MPVICTEQTGIAEVVRDYDAGIVVSVGAPDAIRAAIERLLADPDELAIMKDNARCAATTHLSFRAYVSAIRAVYDEVAL